MRVPSGEYATPLTQLVWPVRVWRVSPVVVSQMRAVLSSLAVAMRVPSGEYATPHTELVWPLGNAWSAPQATDGVAGVISPEAIFNASRIAGAEGGERVVSVVSHRSSRVRLVRPTSKSRAVSRQSRKMVPDRSASSIRT